MKILVMVKQVPDTATQVKVAERRPRHRHRRASPGSSLPTTSSRVEEALRIKEKRRPGTRSSRCPSAPERAKEALRSCLAMGADRAIHLTDPGVGGRGHADHGAGAGRGDQAGGPGARALRAPGDRRRHGGRGRAGGRAAGLAVRRRGSWRRPSTTAARRIRVARQVEGGLEVFDVPLPAVVSAQKGLNEPRYPTLKGIMGAKKKEIKDVKAADLGITPEPPALDRREARGPAAAPARPHPSRRARGLPSRSWSARSAKTPKRSKSTGDPNPMAGAFWCIVEDDRQGNPKKVMAEVLGRGRAGSRGQMGGQAEAVWLTDKATPEGLKHARRAGRQARLAVRERGVRAVPGRGVDARPRRARRARSRRRRSSGAVTTRQRELMARLAARLGAGLVGGLHRRSPSRTASSSRRAPCTPASSSRR